MAAIERVLDQYDSLVVHLGDIIADSLKPRAVRIYDAKGHQKAQELRDGLSDQDLIVLLFLQVDVLSLTSVQSLFYQHSAQSIIGQFL